MSRPLAAGQKREERSGLTDPLQTWRCPVSTPQRPNRVRHTVFPFGSPASPPLVVPSGNGATPPESRPAECPIRGTRQQSNWGWEWLGQHHSPIWCRLHHHHPMSGCSSAWMSSESEGTNTTGASLSGWSARLYWYTLGASQPTCLAFFNSSCL